jgi:hypothetical protein
MPKIPYAPLANSEPRAFTQNRQSAAGATPDAFGAGMGKGLEVLGAHGVHASQQLLEVAEDIKRRDDERAARDALTAYSIAQREILYGTPDKPGYYGLKGQMAVDAHSATAKQLSDAREKLGKNLNSESLRMYEYASQSQLQTNLEGTTRYAVDQRNDADMASYVSFYEESKNLAAANPYDPDNIAQTRQNAEIMMEKIARLKGITDPVTLQTMKDDADTEVLMSAMESIIQRDDVASATEFYKQYQKDINGKVQIKIEKKLEVAAKAERIDREHQAVLARQEHEMQMQANSDAIFAAVVGGDADAGKKIREADIKPAEKRAYWAMLESITKAGGADKIKTDGPTFRELYRRIHLPDGDPAKLTDETELNAFVINGQLAAGGDNSIVTLRQEIQSLRGSPEGKAEAERLKALYDYAERRMTMPQIPGVAMSADPKGGEIYLAWRAEVDRRLAEGKKNGLTLDQMLDPKGEHYVGWDIETKVRPMDVFLNDLLGASGSTSVSPGTGAVTPTVAPVNAPAVPQGL